MSNGLVNQPLMSLRSSGTIGTAVEPIINPHNMKILGWWCKSPSTTGPSILLTEDVREIMPTGLAVNDEAALSSPNDLVRHREMLDIRFQLSGKTVKTKRHKLGKVSDYSYDETSMFVQKLYVARPLVKIFANEDTLIVDRSQIIEVTDNYILVEDTEVKATDEEVVPAGATAISG